MTNQPITFTNSIDLPDGRRIYVSLEIPGDHLVDLFPQDLGEHTEVVQMAAAGLLGHVRRMDRERGERVPF